jgi:hypothetical protein
MDSMQSLLGECVTRLATPTPARPEMRSVGTQTAEMRVEEEPPLRTVAASNLFADFFAQVDDCDRSSDSSETVAPSESSETLENRNSAETFEDRNSSARPASPDLLERGAACDLHCMEEIEALVRERKLSFSGVLYRVRQLPKTNEIGPFLTKMSRECALLAKKK